MNSFPYTPHPANLRKFLDKIQEVGVPSKVTRKYLESLGFKSSNDRYIPRVLQALGFIDIGRVPTDKWRLYRDRTKAPGILAEALQNAYGELFKLYPHACERTDEELRNFFSSHTELGEKTIKYVIRTFKTLCELADFSKIKPQTRTKRDNLSTPSASSRSPVDTISPETYLPQIDKFVPSIHIDIQIHISPEASLEQIEAIFKNMAKYIFRAED